MVGKKGLHAAKDAQLRETTDLTNESTNEQEVTCSVSVDRNIESD